MEFEGRDEYMGYGTVLIEPRIFARYILVYKHFFKDQRGVFTARVAVFGCYDNYALRDLQINHNYKQEQDLASKAVYLSDADWLKDGFKPSWYDGCPIFDFENGKLINWTTEGTAFQKQPTYGDNRLFRKKGSPSGIIGKWWISSYDLHPSPDALRTFTSKKRKGTLLSPKFYINTTRITFSLGGGDHSGKIGVQLMVFNQVVREIFLSSQRSYMKREYWETDPYLHKPAQIKLIDDSTTGYIMFDDLRTYQKCNDGRYTYRK